MTNVSINVTVSLCFSDQLKTSETFWESCLRMSKRRCYCYGLTGALWVFDDLLLHFLGCKDESRGRATCIKLVKEMGIQVCYTDVAPLKAKLERSCGETCKFCKHHKWYSHNSLNARPNRTFHRFFLFYWVLLRPLREYQSTVVARVPWD